MSQPQVSIVVPLLNEAESLPELMAWIDRTLKASGHSYEVVFIDDGSTDKSWHVIGQLSGQYPEVRGHRFTRNYGKSAALNAAFRRVKGEVVVTMDADLQDSPEEIPELYRMITEEGYDLVSGWKKKRYDPWIKRSSSKLFNSVTRLFSGVKLHDFNCGLKAYRGHVARSIFLYGEMHRYIPAMAKWNGFRHIGEKVVQHQARKFGKSKFGGSRFVRGFLDLLSITFVSKFARRPMHFFGAWGILFFLLGFGLVLWMVGNAIYWKWIVGTQLQRELVDLPSFYLALTALIIGAQLFLAGFLGEMMVKHRAKEEEAIISETVGTDD